MGRKEKEEVEAAIHRTLKRTKSSYSWIKGAVEIQEKEKGIPCDQGSDQVDTPMVIPYDQKELKKVTGSDLRSDLRSDHLLAEKLILEDWPQLNLQSLKPFIEEGKFTIEDLQDHLDIAHYNIEKMKNTEKPVRDRHSFLFSTLRKGYITPLEGYKSRTEMALEKRLQLKKQRIERIKALKKQLLQAEFEEFYHGLSEEELAEIKKKAEEKYNPQGLISKELQVKLALNEFLRKRFAEKCGYPKEPNVEIKEDV